MVQRKFVKGFDFTQAIDALGQAPDDMTFSILKAHLLVEELLRQYLSKCFPNPKALDGARLTYAQLAAVGEAFTPASELNSWLWNAVQRLNKIRNVLAHELIGDSLEKEVEEYLKYCLQHMPPLPRPKRIDSQAAAPRVCAENGPMYSPLDMVNAGLLSILGARFGIPVVDSPTPQD